MQPRKHSHTDTAMHMQPHRYRHTATATQIQPHRHSRTVTAIQTSFDTSQTTQAQLSAGNKKNSASQGDQL